MAKSMEMPAQRSVAKFLWIQPACVRVCVCVGEEEGVSGHCLG